MRSTARRPPPSPLSGSPPSEEATSPLDVDTETLTRSELSDSSGSSSSIRTFQGRRHSADSRRDVPEQSIRAIISYSVSSPSRKDNSSPLASSHLAHTRSPSDSLRANNSSAPRHRLSISIPVAHTPSESLCSTPIQSAVPHALPRGRRRSGVTPLSSLPSAPTPSPTPFFTDDEFTADDPDLNFDFDSEWDTGSVTTSASTHASSPLVSPDTLAVHLPHVEGVPHQPPLVASGEEDFTGLERSGLRSSDRARALSPGTFTSRNAAQAGITTSDGEGAGVRKRQQVINHSQSESEYGTFDVDDLDFDDCLPHIPLRPFRNQVGGHSAIYRFTKRAVCKVSIFSILMFYNIILRSSSQ